MFDLRLIVIESIMYTIGLWDTHYDIIRWGKFMMGVMIMDDISFWGWCDAWTYPYKNTDRERKNTNHTYRNCWYFSLIILLFIREEADVEVRRGSSTFKNMPFLGVEDALLHPWKVYSSSLPHKPLIKKELHLLQRISFTYKKKDNYTWLCKYLLSPTEVAYSDYLSITNDKHTAYLSNYRQTLRHRNRKKEPRKEGRQNTT